MESGKAHLHGTTIGFLVVGFSYENLYFKKENETEIKILESGSITPALRCSNCEIVILNKSIHESISSIDVSNFTKLTRDGIYDIIRFWSSKENQNEYQKMYPESNVTEELFWQWRNNYVPDSEDFNKSFTLKELQIFRMFDYKLIKEFEKLADDLPTFEEFIRTKSWSMLNKIALEMLNELNE